MLRQWQSATFNSIYILDMKVKPGNSRSNSSSSAPLIFTNRSSVRSTPETNDCYAVDLTINSTGNHLATLTSPSSIQLFDASTLKPVSSLSSTSNNFDSNDPSASVTISAIQYAYISPHTLLASTNKNLVLVWDTRTPQQETSQLNGCADEHQFLSVTCNNEDLLVAAGTQLKGDENVAIAFWDLRAPINKQLLGYYTESHSDDIIHVQFNRMKSKELISGATDGLVCLYDVSKSNEEDALEQVWIEVKYPREKKTIWFCRFITRMDRWLNVVLRNRIQSMPSLLPMLSLFGQQPTTINNYSSKEIPTMIRKQQEFPMNKSMHQRNLLR